MARVLWTRDELIQLLILYCQIPFGKMDRRNGSIIELATKLGRTPSAVALKMVNFASLDPTLHQRGMANASSLDREVWQEFFQNIDEFIGSGQHAIPSTSKSDGLSEEGTQFKYWSGPTEKESIVTTRSSQGFFRRMVLASYSNTCAISGINDPSLLVAGHIISWASAPEMRMNPHNGICLNYLHDRAFESGFIAIGEKFEILYSSRLGKTSLNALQKIAMPNFIPPNRFVPFTEFFARHRKERFVD